MKAKAKKTGPKPEVVKIHDHWHMAVKKALKKKRPAGGWPSADKKPPVG
jgi:hypothetical protein